MPLDLRDPSPLYHSWPLFDGARRLAVGAAALPCDARGAPSVSSVRALDGKLAAAGVGVWECDLADNSLLWSSGVHQLFGLPEDEPVERALAVSLYAKASRAAMERMRAHAIRFRRGFTMDAEIRTPAGDTRWIRLTALPLLNGRRVTHLRGLKVDVTAEYGGATVRRLADGIGCPAGHPVASDLAAPSVSVASRD